MPEPARQPEFFSLVSALEGYFGKPEQELPEAVRARVVKDFPFGLGFWKKLAAHQQRSAAEQWDAQHDPALEPQREAAWREVIRLHEVRGKIREYELAPVRAPSEIKLRDDRLAELHAEEERIEKRLKGPRQQGLISAERDCCSWLAELMKAQKLKAKDDYRSEALMKWGGLSNRGFERAWRRATEGAEKTWSRPGRRKSKS